MKVVSIFILLSSIFNVLFPQDVTLTFDCPDEVVAGSEENIFPVNVDALINVMGFQFEVPFDNTLFEIINVSFGEMLNDMMAWAVNEDTLQIISFNFNGTPSILAGTGNLLNIHFNSLGDAGNEFQFSFVNVTMSDEMAHFIDADVSDTCTITVVEPDPQIGDECITGNSEAGFYNCVMQCIPETMSVGWQSLGDGYCDDITWGAWWNCPEFGYDCGDCNPDWDGSDPLGFCEAACNSQPGDINEDGSINVQDIVLAVNWIVACYILNECEAYLSDFNGDGTFNILDIVYMVNIILGVE